MVAHKKEWWTRYKEEQTEHIRHIHFKGDKNTNKMERLNGEIRDREKVMRSLKKMTLRLSKACRFIIITFVLTWELMARHQVRKQGSKLKD